MRREFNQGRLSTTTTVAAGRTVHVDIRAVFEASLFMVRLKIVDSTPKPARTRNAVPTFPWEKIETARSHEKITAHTTIQNITIGNSSRNSRAALSHLAERFEPASSLLAVSAGGPMTARILPCSDKCSVLR